MVDIFQKLPLEPIPGASPPKIELSEQRTDDPQMTLIEIGAEFLQHDRIALSRLTPEERQEQVQARALLTQHVVTYWEQAKANGWDPATRDEWDSVAGMIDLVQALLSSAQEAAEDDQE